MSLIKRNLLANLTGTAWAAILSLAVIPVYLRLLGADAYGLVGFYNVLQPLVALLDLGLGTAAIREVARLSAQRGAEREIRTVVRTLELAYWGMGVVIALLGAAAAPLIASRWLHSSMLSTADVTRALILMSVALALHFPNSLYVGVLMGTQRQTIMNATLIAGITLRLAVPIPLLLMFGKTVFLYFGWQVIAGILQTWITRAAAMRAIPRVPDRTRADLAVLRKLQGYAAGVTGVLVLSAIVLQTDRIAVSRFSALGDFGYYTVAATIAGGMIMIAHPVGAAVFPRLSQDFAAGSTAAAAALYGRSLQVVIAYTAPLAAVIAVFPRELLFLWTRDARAAAQAGPPLTLLMLAMTASAIGIIPLYLQLAAGWTSFPLAANAIGAVILFPATIFAASRSGAIGAAAVVCGWHVVLLVVSIIATARRLNAGTGVRALVPLVLAFAITLAVRATVPVPEAWHGMLAVLALTGAAALAASVAATPLTWQWLRERRQR